MIARKLRAPFARFACLTKCWIAVFLVSLTASARAFTPENGLYNMFSADAHGGEGTGLAVDIQNDYLFAAGFVFRPDGSPTFVTIEGTLKQEADGALVLSGENALYTFAGGQCIGDIAHCPYKQPASMPIGSFSLVFTAENEGRLDWGTPDNRAVVNLRRSCSGTLCYDAPSSLLGEWDVIIDHAAANGLRFGGDKLAIGDVTSRGDRRTIAGCVAPSDASSPNCAHASTAKVEGVATRCDDRACSGYRYTLTVHANAGAHRERVVRVYTFLENGHGGAFGGTIRGHVDLCPAGARTPQTCKADAGLPFVAYKSASVGFVRSGAGTN
jgi:hypothetical protein